MHIPQRPPKAVGIGRHQHEMDMVGHQAIGPHLRPRPLCRLGKEIEIERAVSLLEERLLTTVATLRDVVRDAGNNASGQAGHGLRVTEFGDLVKCHRNPVKCHRNPRSLQDWFIRQSLHQRGVALQVTPPISI